jgi:hypothetical protein
VRFLFTLFITFFICIYSFAENHYDPRSDRKSFFTKKTLIAPKIDGLPDDTIWQSVTPISDFRQFLPVYEAAPSFQTEVKITYDDYAIYILAEMFDPNPDSILRQLGLRDDDHLNADMFSIEFDTYNNQLDAYSFLVTASGVQMDWRESDETYDAVWDSEVTDNQRWLDCRAKNPIFGNTICRKPVAGMGNADYAYYTPLPRNRPMGPRNA